MKGNEGKLKLAGEGSSRAAEQSCSASRLQTTTAAAFSQNSHLATPDIGKAQGIQIHSLILIKNQHDTASGPYYS